MQKTYHLNLLRKAVILWQQALPVIRAEKKSIEMKQDLIVRKYLMNKVGRKVFKELR